VVIERAIAGFGASGRNAGHLTPTIGKDLPTLARFYGRERAEGCVPPERQMVGEGSHAPDDDRRNQHHDSRNPTRRVCVRLGRRLHLGNHRAAVDPVVRQGRA
jgi:glycine/D-amino acid oxidase-like deaminating enzyme